MEGDEFLLSRTSAFSSAVESLASPGGGAIDQVMLIPRSTRYGWSRSVISMSGKDHDPQCRPSADRTGCRVGEMGLRSRSPQARINAGEQVLPVV